MKKSLLSLLRLLLIVCLPAMLGVLPDLCARAADGPQPLWVYVGTYTGEKCKGIYVSKLDPASGKLSPAEVAAEVKNPSFLAIHPNRQFLYAVSEVDGGDGKSSGGVSAFAIDAASGKLKLLNQQSSQGAGPCHLVVDSTGKYVLVANYGGGSVAALPIGGDGALKPATAAIQHTGSSVNPQRQKEPHAHSINLDPGNRFAFAADLGLDRVLVYRFDAGQGRLTANDPPAAKITAGAGPRHFAFLPGGRFAYVINEMANTMTAFQYDAGKGVLTTVQEISTLPAGFHGTSYTAEVVAHPSGKFVYGSNRGHDSIAIFAVDPDTGKLTARGHQATGGKTPRNFSIDPSGTFLLAENQDSGTIAVFRIDLQTGMLADTGNRLDVPMPVCVRMLPVAP